MTHNCYDNLEIESREVNVMGFNGPEQYTHDLYVCGVDGTVIPWEELDPAAEREQTRADYEMDCDR